MKKYTMKGVRGRNGWVHGSFAVPEIGRTRRHMEVIFFFILPSYSIVIQYWSKGSMTYDSSMYIPDIWCVLTTINDFELKIQMILNKHMFGAANRESMFRKSGVCARACLLLWLKIIKDVCMLSTNQIPGTTKYTPPNMWQAKMILPVRWVWLPFILNIT